MTDKPSAAERDFGFMQRALGLARQNLGVVWPNPSVGCVVVQDGQVVAEAVTQPGGRPHAETQALALAGEQARDATVYVTLEPCSHWGQTPPCAEALIEARVERVVVSTLDDDPRVSGQGIDKLLEAGISVETSVCEDEARALYQGFFHRVRTQLPLLTFVDLNQEQALAGFDAVVVGVAEWDPPSFADARFWFVLDSLEVPPQALIDKSAWVTPAMCLVVAEDRSPSRISMIAPKYPQLLKIPSVRGQGFDFLSLLRVWGEMGLTHVAIDSRAAPADAFDMPEDDGPEDALGDASDDAPG